jgi:hypothetical protein
MATATDKDLERVDRQTTATADKIEELMVGLVGDRPEPQTVMEELAVELVTRQPQLMQWLVPPDMYRRRRWRPRRIANRVYIGLAVATLIVQVSIRLDHCNGMAGCALSMAKAPVWAAFWPLYLPVYLGALP